MTTLADRYVELSPDRDAALRRARLAAAITVPSVLPPEGTNAYSTLPQNHSSFGSRAAKNLASKINTAQLPPGDSAFQLTVPLAALVKEGKVSVPPELTKNLALIEQLVNSKVETLAWRRSNFVTALHLIVAGNVAEYVLPDGRIKHFRLDQYVCVRDSSGTTTELVTCETMKVRQLPQELQQRTNKKPEDDCRLYTGFSRIDENRFEVRQDLDADTIHAPEQAAGEMPVNAMVWDLVPGETYGRGHVEDNYNDLESLDRLSMSIRDLAAMASRNLIFVRPNAAGGNLRDRIAKARNGAVLSGNEDDVHTMQFTAGGQLAVLREEKNDTKRDLAAAFLLSAGVQRDAERVTAYELRMLIQELESALGGVYSLLSGFLAWRLRKLIEQMQRRQELPQLGKDALDIKVTTGLEALGADARLNKVFTVFDLVAKAGAVSQDVAMYVKFDEVLTPGFAALGFPAAIRTDAEVQQMRAEQQEAEMQRQIATAAAGPVATAATQQLPI